MVSPLGLVVEVVVDAVEVDPPHAAQLRIEGSRPDVWLGGDEVEAATKL